MDQTQDAEVVDLTLSDSDEEEETGNGSEPRASTSVARAQISENEKKLESYQCLYMPGSSSMNEAIMLRQTSKPIISKPEKE